MISAAVYYNEHAKNTSNSIFSEISINRFTLVNILGNEDNKKGSTTNLRKPFHSKVKYFLKSGWMRILKYASF